MEKQNVYVFTAMVVPYPGMAAWRFVSLPQELSSEIKTQHSSRKKAWGSIPVLVTVRETTWEASIFPDKKSQTYLLPLKAEVRKKERIMDRERVDVCLRIRS